MKKLLLSCTVALATALSLPAQEWTPPVSSSLSNPMLTALAEGTDGYLWIGTRRGLNRYNGSIYKIYYQGDSTTLTSDRIFSLCPDTGRRLWIGTEAGINLIQDGKVVRRSFLKFNPITTLLNYDENHLVYGSQLGVCLYDKESGESTVIFDAPRFTYSSSLLKTREGGLIVAGRSNRPSIAILDPHFNLVREITLTASGNLNGMALGPDGTLFAATGKGLRAWAADGNRMPQWSRMLEAATGQAEPHVLFLATDPQNGHLIAGVADRGIYDIPLEDGQIQQTWVGLDLQGVRQAHCLLGRQDIWLSTDRGGLIHQSRNSITNLIRLQNLAPLDAISRLISWEGGMTIVQTQKKILLLNPATGVTRDLTPAFFSPEKSIIQARMDRRGYLWVIYNYETLYQFRVGTDRLHQQSAWPVSGVRAIWENEDGSMSFIQESRIHTIREGIRTSRPLSRAGEYWRVMPTWTGKTFFFDRDKLYQYTKDGLFQEIPVVLSAPNSLTEDKQGRIWIGTSNSGLVCYDPLRQATTEITTKDGLPDNAIRSVVPNDYGVWVSMRNEIAFVSNNLADIIRYSPGEGETVDFANNAFVRTESGDILFGANEHVLVLHPKRITRTGSVPTSLDALLVNNLPLEIPEGELNLDHTQNLVVFYYSALDFDHGNQLSYEHRLVGHDNQWIKAGQSHRAFYSNLSPGKYRFLVKVQTPDGTWQEEQELLHIRIKPVPWLSWPAKATYALIGLGLLALLIWLTERTRSNKERAERAELERSLGEQMSRDKTDFFMNISHEYRTPLSLIYGPTCELARNNNLDAHDRHLVRLIERNAEKMMSLTEQIVNFDKFSRSTDHLAVLRTDLGQKLAAIVRNFEYIREQRSLDIRTDFPEDTTVWCDRDKIEKIFFNLLSNAVKYTPDGGSIRIRLSTATAADVRARYELPDTDYDGAYAEVTVSDTGIGIEPDKIDLIFQRYERLGRQVGEKVPEGLGLGLNHVLYLIGLHRGAIQVRPNEETGTTFSFVIPAEKEAYSGEEIWREVPVDASGKISEAVPIRSAGKDLSLLIVEDNDDMRTYLHELFHETYNVMLASDGEEALRFIQISAPDIILSDVMMPYKDGLQLCRELKESPEYCHLPVILLTAKTEMTERLEGLGLGADAYLGKPFDPQYLRTLVQNLLDNRRRIQKALGEKTADQIDAVLQDLPVGTHDKAFIEKLYGLIEEHLAEEEFNVSSLAGMMGMSRSGLFSKVKALTGQSPQEFLTGYRLARARELLLTHEYNISEVAYKVGFSTLNGLSRAFKNKYGVPPSAI